MPSVSGERVRDELFKLLEIPDFAESLRLMQSLQLLQPVFPHIDQVFTLEAIPPHVHDLWEHTLQAVLYLETFITGTNPNPARDLTGSHLSAVLDNLQAFQQELSQNLDLPLQADRKRRSLLLLAMLYHDLGKPSSRTLMPDGRLHFREHPQKGSAMVADLCSRLLFGTEECKYLQLMVAQHMRIHHLANPRDPFSRRAIYRYYLELGNFGVDLTLISLADTLAAKEDTLQPAGWQHELGIARQLLDAWYSRQSEVVDPPKLLDGNDLQHLFTLKPGPLLGLLLASLREAQAEGFVTTQQEALVFCQELIEAKSKESDDAALE